ncbi:FeoB small GTPase domain-containing protein [Chloroflexota bacterium]
MGIWRKTFSTVSFGLIGDGCHGEVKTLKNTRLKKIGIVGSPNVGKSVIFNSLTGAHVTVSNYPGTTVDVSRGKAKINGKEYEVVDTPGMYSFLPITEEERVARLLLLNEKPDIILHVVDARNLERMLPLTIQLIEADLPVVLDLNMTDEAELAGINVRTDTLEEELGVPVVTTIATSGHGIDQLRKTLGAFVDG